MLTCCCSGLCCTDAQAPCWHAHLLHPLFRCLQVRTFAYGTDASFYRLNPKMVVKVRPCAACVPEGCGYRQLGWEEGSVTHS